MKKRVHDNSIDAYHQEEQKLSAREQAIKDWITEHGPHTDREVAYGMGFGENLNAVRPRITKLLEKQKLMSVGNVQCSFSKKRVRRVDIRQPRLADND